MEVWIKVTKKTKEFIGIKCDNCGEISNINYIHITLDTEGEKTRYDFCKESCAIKFLALESRKKYPETRFITGEERE